MRKLLPASVVLLVSAAWVLGTAACGEGGGLEAGPAEGSRSGQTGVTAKPPQIVQGGGPPSTPEETRRPEVMPEGPPGAPVEATPKGSETTAPEIQPNQKRGVLVGRVTRGPLSPVERERPSRGPLPGARINISRPDGQEVGSVTTDARGMFRVSLPPGTYRVTMAPLGGMAFSKDLPATVTIAQGKETRLDVRIDTGIR